MSNLTIVSEIAGKLYPYDKTYDRITTKTEKPLQLIERFRDNSSTSDDPIIQEVR